MPWGPLPAAARTGQVAVLASVEPQVGAATINRKLVAIYSFYAHQARHGVDLGDLLTAWGAPGRSAWKPFLHHISKGTPQKRRMDQSQQEPHFGVPPRELLMPTSLPWSAE